MKRAQVNQSGSVFTVLLAGIAIAGALSVAMYNTLSGPLAARAKAMNVTAAQTQMQAIGNIIIVDAATNLPSGGDCTGASIGYVVPRSWTPPGANPHPTNGGLLPTVLGAPTTDPWGTNYGYCVWEVGYESPPGTPAQAAACASTNGGDQTCTSASCTGGTGGTGCTGSTYNGCRHLGSSDPTTTTGVAASKLVIAIISAGPDRKFQTTCNDFTADSASVITAGGDDVVQAYTYTQAASATADLWTLSPTTFVTTPGDTAVINKNLAVGYNAVTGLPVMSVTTQGVNSGLITGVAVTTSGVVTANGGVELGWDNTADTGTVPNNACTATSVGLIRYNLNLKEIQVCDTTTTLWINFASGTGATSIDGLTDAQYDITTLHNMTLGMTDPGPPLTTGAFNVAIGRGTGVSLTAGSQNTALGWAALNAMTKNGQNTAVGYGALTAANDTTTTAYASQNTAVGFDALANVTNGSASIGGVALGYKAGSTLTANSGNNILIGNGISGAVISAAVVSGGTSGYAVGDTVTLPVAGGTIAATLTVTSVASGVITGVVVNNPGNYITIPANPVSQASTNGAGLGTPTFTLTFYSTNYLNIGGIINGNVLQAGGGLLAVNGTGQLQLPNGTGVQAPTCANYTGGLRYQTDGTPGFYGCNGASWSALGSGGGAAYIDALSDARYDNTSQFNMILGKKINLAAGAKYNLFIGQLAGSTVANSGNDTLDNIAIGYNSLSSLYDSGPNTAIGVNAGANNAYQPNVFVGTNAGLYARQNETAIGESAMKGTVGNLTCCDNYSVAAGYHALINIGGNGGAPFYYTAVGSGALSGGGEFGSETAVGYHALTSETAGSVANGNTAVGASTLAAATHNSNNTAIGYNALILTNDSVTATNASNNTAVGTLALSSNGSGIDSTAVGSGALQKSTAGGLTAVGYNALTANTSGTQNTAVGWRALAANTINTANTAMGYNALANNNSASSAAQASSNTAVGAYALAANTIGIQNTAMGYSALAAVTTASNLTAVGYNALAADTTGTGNTALGSQALAAVTQNTGNTAIGYQALLVANDTVTAANASQNTAVGTQALVAMTTGIGNTAMGYQAGNMITSGGGNLFLGNGWTTEVLSVAIASGGASYVVNDTLTLPGTGTMAATLTVTSVSSGVITGVLVANPGSYTAIPSNPVAATGGTGTGATFNLTFATSVAATTSNYLYIGGIITGDMTLTAGLGQGIAVNGTGMLQLPFGTTAQGPVCSGSYTGGLRYQTDGTTPGFYGCNGGAWILLTTGSGASHIDALTDARYDNTSQYNMILGQKVNLAAGANYNLFIGQLAGATATNSASGMIDNIAIGYEAGSSWSGATAYYNLAIGYNALAALGNSSQNIAIGTNALGQSTTAHNLYTAIGESAMKNSSGGSSVAIGYKSFLSGSGGDNVAVGSVTFLSGTFSGPNNVAVGYGAGAAVGSTAGITAVGASALAVDVLGGYSTAVGYNALEANGGANNTAVGNIALAANVSGILNTAIGSGALAVATVSDLTAVGYNALAANTTGIQNTALGYNALAANTINGGNTAMGYNALALNNSTTSAQASNNTAYGAYALAANTTGIQNTAVGYNALAASTAISLTAIGYNALAADISGTGNTAVGSQALAAVTQNIDNTAIGYQALAVANDGTTAANASYNTAVGYQALSAVTTGVSNTALGYQAGSMITTGGGNLFLGNGWTTEVLSVAIASGGASYVVNDTLTLPGTGATAATLTVTSVSSGVITGVLVANPGSYTAIPSNPVAATGGTGTGATFNLTFATSVAATTSNYLYIGGIITGDMTLSGGQGIAVNGTGLLQLPNGTSANRPTCSSYTGGLRYETDSTAFYGCSSGAWTSLTSGGAASHIDALTDAIYDNTSNYDLVLGQKYGLNSYTQYEVLIGQNAGGTSATAFSYPQGYDVGIGYNALATLTSNSADGWNVAIGVNANENIGSNYDYGGNVSIGTNAFFNSNGGLTVAIGEGAESNNTVGNNGGNDVAVGFHAFMNGGAGGGEPRYYTAVGSGALTAGGGIGREVAVGYNALTSEVQDGYSAFNVAIGASALAANSQNFANTAVGYHALLLNNDSSNNFYTGSSHASWNTAIGNLALAANVTGRSNTAVGSGALQNSTTNYLTAAGYNALAADTSGTQNTAVGWKALAANTINTGNTAMGYNALANNNSASSAAQASNNTAFGALALAANISGSDSTAVGYNALAVSTVSNLTAVGYNALAADNSGTGNTAFGSQALAAVTQNTGDTAIGYQALLVANDTVTAANASQNTAVGTQALVAMTTGIGNTAMGYQAGSMITTGGGNLFLGNGWTTEVLSAAIASGGASYVVNDTLTLPGTGTMAATLTVTSVSSGVITGVLVANPGSYTAIPSNPVAATGGTGTGATFNLTFATSVAATTSNYLYIGGIITGDMTLSGGQGIAVNGTGMLQLPNGTSANRPTCSSYTGGLRYETDSTAFYGCSSGAWTSLTSGGAASHIDALNDARYDNTQYYNMNLGQKVTLHNNADYNLFIGQNAGATAVHSTAATIQNTAIGYNAMSALMGGADNTAIGVNAVSSNIGSYDWNVGVGYNALKIVANVDNVGIGDSVLAHIGNSQNDTAVGFHAGTTTAYSNLTAVGSGALALSTDSANSGETAVGYNALAAETTGNQNTAAGASALAAITILQDSTAVGYNAALLTTGGDNTAIGKSALAANTGGVQSTAVGSGALAADTASAVTAVGYNALKANISGSGNTAVGWEALAANTINTGNTAMGYNALANNNSATTTQASNNTAFGALALAANISGSGSTAVGYNALAVSTVSNLTAVGYNALAADNSGTGNTAFGSQALAAVTQNTGNTAVGYQALLVANDTVTAANASQNTAVGTQALVAMTTGIGNTAMGYQAGSMITSGGGNLFIGNGWTTEVLSAAIASGGASYVVNDTLTLPGTGATAATLTVTSVSSGVITGVLVANPGSYTAIPSNPVAATGGTGTGATFNLTFATSVAATTSNYLYIGGIITGDMTLSGGQGIAVNGTGMLQLPFGTTAQGPVCSGSYTGGLRYQTDGTTPGIYGCNGASWTLLTSGSGASHIDALTDARYDNTSTYNMDIGQKVTLTGTGSTYDLFIGQNAGISAANSSDNYGGDAMAIGYNAMAGDQGGSSNATVIGVNALMNEDDDTNDVAVGYNTLYSNGVGGSGYEQIAVGEKALASAATDSYDTAVGFHAATKVNGVGNLTVIGSGALANDTSDGYITAVGYNALGAEVQGAINSTAVGASALASMGSANIHEDFNTAVGYNALMKASDPVSGGDQSLTAIGNLALTADTTGEISTAVGSGALAANQTASNLTAVGNHALYANTTGTENTAVGWIALAANTINTGNTAMGYAALANNNSAVTAQASNNTAFGANALEANVIGKQNTAVGYYALAASNVDSLTAIGYNALAADNSGTGNTAFGSQALAAVTQNSNNTAVGYQALLAANDAVTAANASQNTAVGTQALSAVTTGIGNTAMGYQAGSMITTGGGNLFLGNGWTTEVLSVAIASGGASYVVNDTLTLPGTGATAATLTVTSVSSGVITGVLVANPGSYTAIPSNPVAATGGTGTGATFNLTFATSVAATTSNYLYIGGIITGDMTLSGGQGIAVNGTGLLQLPFGTTAQGPVCTSYTGGLRYQTDGATPGFYGCSSGAWSAFGSGGGGATHINALSDAIYDNTSKFNMILGQNYSLNTYMVYEVFVGQNAGGTAAGTRTTNQGSDVGIGYNALATLTNINGDTNNVAIGVNANENVGTNFDAGKDVSIGTNANLNPGGGSTVAVGEGALSNNTLSNNESGSVAVGWHALINGGGGGGFPKYYTAVGSGALTSGSQSGGDVAVGYNALNSNMQGNYGAYDTAIGASALAAMTNDCANTAVGYHTLLLDNASLGSPCAGNSSASLNTAIGNLALSGNFTGIASTAVGSGAAAADTASDITAVGYNALTANTTGTQNTAVGWQALAANTLNTGNTAMGYNALALNNSTTTTQASYNTAFGSYALAANVTGSDNTAFGSYALAHATVSDLTAIGYNALEADSTGVQNTAVGSGALAAVTQNSYNTAVGYNALVLTNDATTAANASSNTAVGYTALAANTTGAQNTAVGYNALAANTASSDLTAIGYYALAANTTGIQNTAIGSLALQHNTINSYNTAIGYFALSSNNDATTAANASFNTAIGWHTLVQNTIGASNTGVGTGALANNTTANNNTAVGNNALGNETIGHDNTAIGYQAAINCNGCVNDVAIGLQALDTDANANTDNIAIGYQALYNNNSATTTNSSQNVAIGTNALGGNTTGIGNTAIGYNAGMTNQTGNYNTYLGAGADAASNIEATGIPTVVNKGTSGWVGGGVNLGDLIFLTGGTFTSPAVLQVATVNGSNQILTVNIVDPGNYTVAPSNPVSMGSTKKQNGTAGGGLGTPTFTMTFTTYNGTAYSDSTAIGAGALITASDMIQFGSSAVTQIYLGTSATTNVTADVYTWSDRRLKEDIKDSDLGLDFIERLQPVVYRFKKGPDALHYGFIAQDVERAIGHAAAMTRQGTDKRKTYTIAYSELISPTVKAVQELDRLVNQFSAAFGKLELAVRDIVAEVKAIVLRLEPIKDTVAERQAILIRQEAQINDLTTSVKDLKKQIHALKEGDKK